MDQVTLWTALSMGFLGSLHCAGMCGPIMLILPFQFLSSWKKVLAIALYHFGRISVYAAMGLLLHSFKSIFHPQWQQYISIALGSILLVGGILTFFPAGTKLLQFPWLGFVKRQSMKVIGRPEPGSLFMAGLLNGLLPCGLVYMALSLAATATSTASAVLSMYVFGMGTMPMLLAITLLKGRIRFFQASSIRKFVPAMMLVLGCLFLLRGMNLGISYLSPAITETKQGVKASCCQHHQVVAD
jgi:sulfite exporter TauE/SafE